MKAFEKPWEVTYETAASVGSIVRRFSKEKGARGFYKRLRRRRDVLSMQIVNIIDQCVDRIVDGMNYGVFNRKDPATEQKKMVRSILLECLR